MTRAKPPRRVSPDQAVRDRGLDVILAELSRGLELPPGVHLAWDTRPLLAREVRAPARPPVE